MPSAKYWIIFVKQKNFKLQNVWKNQPGPAEKYFGMGFRIFVSLERGFGQEKAF